MHGRFSNIGARAPGLPPTNVSLRLCRWPLKHWHGVQRRERTHTPVLLLLFSLSFHLCRIICRAL